MVDGTDRVTNRGIAASTLVRKMLPANRLRKSIFVFHILHDDRVKMVMVVLSLIYELLLILIYFVLHLLELNLLVVLMLRHEVVLARH